MHDRPTQNANTARADGTQHRTLWPWVWTAFFLFVAYPLSIGPVANYYKYRQTPPGLIAFYTPLRAIHDRTSIGRRIIDGYLDLWHARR